ncbi:MAG: tetratricopeptide repeat protein [Armatimonadetes bacterium]|jgi:tetratricopeptide (TPR) repeat protein|nr:tetratricopeptide repeat protein [Armatimonadota bacterium]
MSQTPTEAEVAIQALLKEAYALGGAGREADAERLLREALTRLDAEGLRLHPLRGYALHTLRCCYMRQNRFGEAVTAGEQELALLQEHFGPDDPRLAEPLEAVAQAHYHAQEWAPAEQRFERAIALFRRAGPPGERRAAMALLSLGKCFHRQDRFAEAAVRYQQALPVLQGQNPPGAEVIDLLYHLGMAVARQGDPTRAEGLLTRALGLFDRIREPRFPLEFLILSELIRVAEALRQPAVAEQHALRAVAVAESAAPAGHPALSDSLRHLARALAAQGRQAEVQQVLERALPVTEQTYGPHSPVLGGILHNLAGGHFQAGRVDQAAVCEERAVAIYEANARVVGPAFPDSLRCLAMIRQRQGRQAEAQQLAARAQALGTASAPGGVISVGIPKDVSG